MLIMEKSGLYKISFKGTDYFYYGRSCELEKRRCQHLSDLRGGYHKNSFLQHVFNKYGETSFCFEVLVYAEGTYLEDLEQKVLDKYYRTPGCMNLNASAKGSVFSFSEDTRLKMSMARTGKKASEEHKQAISAGIKAARAKNPLSGQKNPFYGKKHSEETKAKMLETRSKNQEWRDNLREGQRRRRERERDMGV